MRSPQISPGATPNIYMEMQGKKIPPAVQGASKIFIV